MQLLAKGLEVVDVMIDRQQLRIGRQSRKPAAALVVLDHAMVLFERREVARERLMIHAGAAVNDDDRRTAAALVVPDFDAVAGRDELCSKEEREKHGAMLYRYCPSPIGRRWRAAPDEGPPHHANAFPLTRRCAPPSPDGRGT